jgi:hypothetical protein
LLTSERWGWSAQAPEGWVVDESLAYDSRTTGESVQSITLLAPQPFVGMANWSVMLTDTDADDAVDRVREELAADESYGSIRMIEVAGRASLEVSFEEGDTGGLTAVIPGDDQYLVVATFMGSRDGAYDAHVGEFLQMRASLQLE